MILQALYELAERENLIEDPDYEMKPVRWTVTIGPGGKFLGFRDTNTTPPQEGKKKPKPVAQSFAVPRDGARTSGDRAFFFCDKAEYVFGLDVEKDEQKRRDPEKLANRFGLFRERISDCFHTTQDEGVKAVMAFLDSLARGEQTVTLDDSTGPGDLFTFIYSSDIDKLVSSREKVRAYWKQLRAENQDDGPEMQCLVTGKTFKGLGLFPKTKRVPGVQGDISLVSYNSRAFESQGWSGNENAPVSREAAEASTTALNRLLHPAFPNPTRLGETLPARSMRLSTDTAICYWTTSADQGFADCLSSIFDGGSDTSIDSVPEMYKSIWRGKAPDANQDISPFYGLMITGTQGRAILRDWFETTLFKAQKNIAQHFADLKIVRNAPWKKGETPPPAIGLRTLLESVASQGKQENIPASVAAQFVHAALTGGVYPIGLLIRAVERMRAEIGHDDWMNLQRRDARVAIIKAVLNRKHRQDKKSKQPLPSILKEVTESMDYENHNPGYLLGQLLAVLERLQQAALGNVNASVIDKYFAGASAAPRSVFPRLLNNARHHAKKAEKQENEYERFMSRWCEMLIDQILWHFKAAIFNRELADPKRSILLPQNHAIPASLKIDDQGWFIIGYHHMRHFLIRMSKEEHLLWESEHPELPKAYHWSKKND